MGKMSSGYRPPDETERSVALFVGERRKRQGPPSKTFWSKDELCDDPRIASFGARVRLAKLQDYPILRVNTTDIGIGDPKGGGGGMKMNYYSFLPRLKVPPSPDSSCGGKYSALQ